MKHFIREFGAMDAVGSALLGVVYCDVMWLLLALVLMISVYKIFSHQKKVNTKGVADKESDEENHCSYKDIVYIESIHWRGGHNTEYPIALAVATKPFLEKVFLISRGWGHGEGIYKLSFDELVSKNFIDILNRPESQKIYEKIIALHQKRVDDKSAASELLKEFGDHVCCITLKENVYIDDILGENRRNKKAEESYLNPESS